MCALRADLGQLGITLNLHTPALVFGQMPVEGVDVVQGQHVDILLNKRYTEVVAGTVEHRTAIAKAWIVDYLPDRQVDRGSLLHGQRLAQRLNAIENTLRRLTLNHDSTWLHRDDIALGVSNFVAQLQRDGSALLAHSGQRDTRGLAHKLFQECGIALHRLICALNDHGGIAT